MKIKIAGVIAVSLAMSVSSASAQMLLNGSGSNSASASSWVGGAHAGYNWQSSSWVYGVETDLSAMRLNSAMNTGLTDGITTATTNADVDWYGTVRGRLGWAQGPLLFYGSGGLAYGRVDLNSSMAMPGLTLNTQTSSVKTGWVAGGGIDYLWTPNLILGVQYQYVDLGSVNLASSITVFGPTSLAQSANAHARFQVVTAGISWLFSPAGRNSRGGWQGFYGGGQIGGAWGNDASAVYSSVSGSDIRLKHDVVLIARLDNGLGLYRYRYLWSDTVYVGVMAQEVALLRPDAIVRDSLDDYLRVDYGRLGLRLMTWPQWQAVSKGARI